jgi:hypothetical protein
MLIDAVNADKELGEIGTTGEAISDDTMNKKVQSKPTNC